MYRSAKGSVEEIIDKVKNMEDPDKANGFQSFSGFGIFFWHLGILTILAFLASLTFWHYEIQKKTTLKSKDAKIKATLVFNDFFF